MTGCAAVPLSVLARYNSFDRRERARWRRVYFCRLCVRVADRISRHGRHRHARPIRRTRIRRFACSRSMPSTMCWRMQADLARPAGRALVAALPEPPSRSRTAGLASRPFGDDPVALCNGTPRRGQSVPRPALRRRYADAPAAALLTGLGAGEWARSSCPRRSPIRPFLFSGDNRRGVERAGYH